MGSLPPEVVALGIQRVPVSRRVPKAPPACGVNEAQVGPAVQTRPPTSNSSPLGVTTAETPISVTPGRVVLKFGGSKDHWFVFATKNSSSPNIMLLMTATA